MSKEPRDYLLYFEDILSNYSLLVTCTIFGLGIYSQYCFLSVNCIRLEDFSIGK